MLSIGNIANTSVSKVHIPANKVSSISIDIGGYDNILKYGDATLSNISRVGVVEVARIHGQCYANQALLQKPLTLNFGRVDKSKTLTVQTWNTTDFGKLLNTQTSSIPEINAIPPTAVPPHATITTSVTFTAGSRLKVSDKITLAQTTPVVASIGKVWLGSSWVEGVSLTFYTSISGSPVGVEHRTALRETPKTTIKAVIYGKATQVMLFAKKAGATPTLIARTDQPLEAIYLPSNHILNIGTIAALEGLMFAYEIPGQHEMGMGIVGSDNLLRSVKSIQGISIGDVVTPAIVAPVKAVRIDSFAEQEYMGDNIKLAFNAIELE
jgi:hypothetical protein